MLLSPNHTNTSCTSAYPQVHGHSSRLWAPHGLLQHQLTAPREAEATHGSPLSQQGPQPHVPAELGAQHWPLWGFGADLGLSSGENPSNLQCFHSTFQVHPAGTSPAHFRCVCKTSMDQTGVGGEKSGRGRLLGRDEGVKTGVEALKQAAVGRRHGEIRVGRKEGPKFSPNPQALLPPALSTASYM